MYRQFELASTTSFQSVWQGMINAGFIDSGGNMLVASVKNQAIVPDRVQQLDLTPDQTNAGSITVTDSVNTPGIVLSNMTKRSNRNSICLKGYFYKGSDNTQKLVVEIQAL